MPGVSSKPVPADVSTTGFPSTFAAMIAAAGDSKLASAQNVDANKTDSSKKKSDSSSREDGSSTADSSPLLATASPAPLTVMPPVIPVALPQLQGRVDMKLSSAAGSQTGTASVKDAHMASADAPLQQLATSATPRTVTTSDIARETGKFVRPGVTAVDPGKAAPSTPQTNVSANESGAITDTAQKPEKSLAGSDETLASSPKKDDSANEIKAIADATQLPEASVAGSNNADASTPKNAVTSNNTGAPKTQSVSQVEPSSPASLSGLSEVAKVVPQQNAMPQQNAVTSGAAILPADAVGMVKQAQPMPSSIPSLPLVSSETHASGKASVDAAAKPDALSSSAVDTSLKAANPNPDMKVATPVLQQDAVQNNSSFSVASATSVNNVSQGKPSANGTAVQGIAVGKTKAALNKVSGAADDKDSNKASGVKDDEQDLTGTDGESLKAHVAAPDVASKDIANGPSASAQGTTPAQTAQAMASAQPGQATPTHVGGSTASVDSPSSATTTAAPAQTSPADNSQVSHALSSAQLIQSAHGSEMKLGMQSAEFGNISINTTLNRQALSAQISIDHSALGHALAVHLPAIEEKLGSAYGVQAKVELRDTGTNPSSNGSNDGSKGSGQGGQSRGESSGSVAYPGPGLMNLVTNATTTSATSTAVSSSRLDIRV